jgi:hypothetical protein
MPDTIQDVDEGAGGAIPDHARFAARHVAGKPLEYPPSDSQSWQRWHQLLSCHGVERGAQVEGHHVNDLAPRYSRVP